MPAPRGKHKVIPGGTRRFELPGERRPGRGRKPKGAPREEILTCLNCTEPDCPDGFCEAVDELLRLYNQGLSDEEIAERTGVKVSTIKIWRGNNRLPKNNKSRP